MSLNIPRLENNIGHVLGMYDAVASSPDFTIQEAEDTLEGLKNLEEVMVRPYTDSFFNDCLKRKVTPEFMLKYPAQIDRVRQKCIGRILEPAVRKSVRQVEACIPSGKESPLLKKLKTAVGRDLLQQFFDQPGLQSRVEKLSPLLREEVMVGFDPLVQTLGAIRRDVVVPLGERLAKAAAG